MISVTYNKPNFYLTFPYNQKELNIVRNLPIRKYDKKLKCWLVHELAVQSLDDVKDLNWEFGAQKVRDKIKKAILSLVDYKFNLVEEEENELEYLRPYQKIGVNFLSNAKKALLADDMGLGKSIQTIQTLMNLKTEKNLIICPSTLKLNWKAEFQKHFNITPEVISGTAAKRKKLWQSDERFIICNYDILSRDWNEMPKQWDAIVCDEIVYLKNHKAQRTKLAKKLKSDVRIGLSGWPWENHLLELHSILEWIRPEIVSSYYHFSNRYMDFGWDGSITGYKNLEELHILTSPYILRREKTDKNILKELPPKIHSDFPLELDPKAEKAYKAICNEFLQWLKEQTGKNWHASILENIIRLRQFVEFPEIVGFKDLANVKLEWLKDTYNGLDKLVVFTYFRDSVELLKNEFNAEFIITGDTPMDDRVPMVDRFNAADKGMFILTDAGKFGLNITGASHITNFGYFYNPATMLQREDRLHRFGQKDVVNVLNPYIIDTIDEGIRSVFLKRQAEAKSFMEGNEQMSIAKLSKEDYKKMILGE